MRFDSPLIRGTLIKRYKRFLADVELEDGTVITAHCANPGSMITVCDPGSRVWLSPHDTATRKLKYSWELLEIPGADGFAGINTARPNRIVEEAIVAGGVAELTGYETMRREVKYGTRNSRIDLLLEDPAKPPCYVEIKNVTMCREAGLAEFPDSVTVRGAKHLAELADVAQSGGRAVMFYLVQRNDCNRCGIARDIDPGYGAGFDKALEAGVEVICYECRISIQEIALDKAIDFAP